MTWLNRSSTDTGTADASTNGGRTTCEHITVTCNTCYDNNGTGCIYMNPFFALATLQFLAHGR